MRKIPIKNAIKEKISGEWGDEARDEKGVVVIRAANFLNTGKINFSNLVRREIDPKKIEKKKLITGDIIIEKSGGSPTQPVGRVVYFENPNGDTYLCNNFTTILRPDKNEVHPEFFFYVLHSNHKQGKTLRFQNKTTGIINLKLDSYLDSEIQLPPLDDQIRIAHLLGKVESLIAQRKQHLQQLDDLLKSVFLEMFGDPVMNEKGWPVVFWDDLFTTRTGKLNANAMSEDGAYPFFTCAKEIFQIDNFAFDCEALILAGNNATGDYDVKYYKGKFNAYQRTYILELKNITDEYSFFKHHLEMKLRQLKDGSKGANTRYLTKQFLETISFIQPDLSLQRNFSIFAKKIQVTKSSYQTSLNELDDLYGVLSQQAFKVS